MSEIAAIFGTAPDAACDTGSGAAERMRRMVAAMGRWPHDAHESWITNDCGLSACILHTTEESLAASQPLANEDETIRVALDGYLANYEELRSDLIARGVRLRNVSDAELVLRAYEIWGEGCAKRIEGEFAFVVIDKRQRRAFCARDHQGLRALYYADTGDALIVASTLPVLLAGLDKRPEPDLEFLAEVMIADVHSTNRTVWKNVNRLNAANWLSWSAEKCVTQRYYSLPRVSFRRFKSDADYVEAYRYALEDAVRRASRTHLPLACEVSGGLDSSAIFCLADRMAKGGNLPAPSIRGFTLRGEPGGASDEIAYARDVARLTGREVHESELFRPDLAWFEEEGRRYCDLPTYTNAAHSRVMEEAMASSGARAVLTGMGGDQWLDGTWGYYQQPLRAFDLRRFWRNVSADIAVYGWAETLPFAVRKSILALLPDSLRGPVRRIRSGYAAREYAEADFLLPHLEQAAARAKRRYLDSLPDHDIARSNQKKLDAVQSQRAFDLMHRQRGEMGLEGRSPMFSRRFIEFTLTVPEDLKFRGGQTKWFHREAMRGIMPASIVERETKATFPEPRHMAPILTMLKAEQEGVLKPLVNLDKFHEFRGLAKGDRVDDSYHWLYWGPAMVVSYLQNSAFS